MQVIIVFTRSRGPFGKAIRYLTSSDVSHVGVLTKDSGPWASIESTAGGFEFRLANPRRLTEVARAYRLNGSDDRRAQFVVRLYFYAGRRYDVLGILQWLAASLGNKLVRRPRWRPRWRVANRLYCSEAVAQCLADTKYCGITETSLHPGELDALCAACPDLTPLSPAELKTLVGVNTP